MVYAGTMDGTTTYYQPPIQMASTCRSCSRGWSSECTLKLLPVQCALRSAAAGAAGALLQGLDRYVKKKKLDALDTYVPLVLEARDRLAGLGSVMGESAVHCCVL